MLDRLIALFAPHHCLGCQAEGALLCGACLQAAPALPERCYHCRALSPEGRTCRNCRSSSRLYRVQAGTEYAGVTKDLVWQLKFSHAQAAVRPMTQLIARRCIFDAEAVLVPVPTASSRVRQRGYDQATLLARELGRQTGLGDRRLLARHGQARQVGATKAERSRHLAETFRVRYPALVRGRHIILVDDVLTTGATVEAAAAALRQAGAKRVDAVVFAQA